MEGSCRRPNETERSGCKLSCMPMNLPRLMTSDLGRECRVGLLPLGNCFVSDWPRRRDEAIRPEDPLRRNARPLPPRASRTSTVITFARACEDRRTSWDYDRPRQRAKGHASPLGIVVSLGAAAQVKCSGAGAYLRALMAVTPSGCRPFLSEDMGQGRRARAEGALSKQVAEPSDMPAHHELLQLANPGDANARTQGP
jgi:hypothetical protein